MCEVIDLFVSGCLLESMSATVDLTLFALLYVSVMADLGSLDVATGKFSTSSKIVCAFEAICRLLVPPGAAVCDVGVLDVE